MDTVTAPAPALQPASEAPPPRPAEPSRPRHETWHEGAFHGAQVRYRCVAEETVLDGPDGKPHAGIFSFSYLAGGAGAEDDGGGGGDPSRPVAFAFNGGPGSASLWLHMGALGPRRVVLPGDGTLAGAGPYSVVENALCCLDRTDLVFIDPPGTGFSRMLGDAKPEAAWGLDADAALVADFIRRWLDRHRRWASPRYLIGESYGTTRAVAVAHKLAGGLSGVAFNGIALISAILDFHTARFERGNPLPDVCWLPTYAATALYHGRTEASAHGGDRGAFLDQVRRFAAEEYLPALVLGARLDAAARQRVIERLAGFTGLPTAWLERTRLRIEPNRFRKELLRDRALTVGRFDGRYVGADYDAAGELPDADPSSYGMDSGFVSSANDHLTRRLGITGLPPYVAFNRDALTKWDWHGPRKDDVPRWPGYVNVAPMLGELLRQSPNLQVLIANGLYDMATPFYAVETTVAGNGIAESGADRVRMTYYDAGHMMYLHEPSLVQLVDDLRGLLPPAAQTSPASDAPRRTGAGAPRGQRRPAPRRLGRK